MNSENKKSESKRVRYLFRGTVQGVGFRPFLYRMAVKNGLTGFAQNTTAGVIAEVEGPPKNLEAFWSDLLKELPPLAHVTQIESSEIDLHHDLTFDIIHSAKQGQAEVHITPDAATCSACLKELFDATNRRYRYPFINCTHCGPRLTITQEIPYDRIHTSMACFPFCEQCLSEYNNPADRRFHAEPNACPVCGPRLNLLDANGQPVRTETPLETAAALLLSGHILAIKGLGGFHLCVDATNTEAVRQLRMRKYREEKPLAIMVRDISTAKSIAEVTPDEENLLISPQRPIVLLRKIKDSPISAWVAPGVPNLGIMLPYTPLHHLLLGENLSALVMTSANQVDEPICIGNRESLQRLQGIADYFLVHNRDILVRCDDSIAFIAVKKQRILRRARGYVPQPILLNEPPKTSPEILAMGGQLKTTLCILKGKYAFLSPHIGDLDTPQARDFFHENIHLIKRIIQTNPRIVACDFHPGYYSTTVAQKISAEKVIHVQHHHAHVVSCMAENHIQGQVIGLAMDGTGYGLDGHAWGGEFLVADESNFKRFAHFQYIVLPGGEKAIREPWRIAVSLLKTAYGPAWKDIAWRSNLVPDPRQLDLLDHVINRRLQSPLSSGLGRVFDGVAALLGIGRRVSFEGQAAMELETLATGVFAQAYPFDIISNGDKPDTLSLSRTIRAIVTDAQTGRDKSEIAAAFHQTLIEAFVRMAEKMRTATGLNRVVLSGGCFQNKILLEGASDTLTHYGFDVYGHSQVPTNDGGISLGQAVVAACITAKNTKTQKSSRKKGL